MCSSLIIGRRLCIVVVEEEEEEERDCNDLCIHNSLPVFLGAAKEPLPVVATTTGGYYTYHRSLQIFLLFGIVILQQIHNVCINVCMYV